jgi:hypothetical protein
VHLTFLTPIGALLALGVVFPLAALALHERRAQRARRALRIEAPRRRSRGGTALALAAVPVLLGLALAQPVLRSNKTAHVRPDAQIFYVFDTSISMRAAPAPEGPTRLARAVAAGRRMHDALREAPSGVASMTDRVLPNVFPTANEQVFASALSDTIGIERPPPKGFNDTATTFAALDTFVGTNFFSEGMTHRIVVLFTDGETAPYFVGDLHEAFRPRPRTRFVIVRVWRADERIHVGRRVDPSYAPDPRSAQAVRTLAGAVGGRAFGEADLGGAIAAARAYLGHGPLESVGQELRIVAFARWLVLATLVPILLLLWRRNLL